MRKQNDRLYLLQKIRIRYSFCKEIFKNRQPISCYLHYKPVFEKGFTVLHLMQILKEYENEVDLIFMSYSRGFKIDPYYQQIIAPITKEREFKIDYLEFS